MTEQVTQNMSQLDERPGEDDRCRLESPDPKSGQGIVTKSFHLPSGGELKG